MKECCETEGPGKKRYWHWVALGCVVIVAAGLQWMPVRSHAEVLSIKANADITSIRAALEEYANNNRHTYPSSLQALVTPDTNGQAYLEGCKNRIPLDPWKHEYLYEAPTAEHPKPHVWTYGADGKRAGIGEDADIDSDRIPDVPR
jgi:type II secretory pathway pseudopilin PulG